MSNQAWVTLATNDSYGLGALVLAHSLRRVGSTFPAVVLITPSVTEAMRERLRAVFAEVVLVDVLDSGDAAHLALLQRPELGITFTKIHCWNLTQYEKCVFLDADTLVIQNCDELFEREELSAAPDVGWPDCFNSGVFVFKPSSETFSNLITFATERGSFDGGDQGLLNSYFSDWAHGDINKHLPFLYNVTSAAFYSYLPALKQFGENLKIIHFIGAIKPWLQQYNWESRTVEAPEHLRNFLQLWWDLFVADVHTKLDTTMTGVAGNLALVVPGVPLQREAIDELTRRQGWETGNIDYMGADSFDNIWSKISQTLSQPPASQMEQSSEQQSEPAPQQICEPLAVETKMDVVEAVAGKQPVLTTAEKEEFEVPKSAELATSEPVVTIPVEVSTPKEQEKAEVPVSVSETEEVSSKIEEPIPIPAEIAAEISATVDVVVPVETSSPSVDKDKPVQAEIPIAALEALKVDEPLAEIPVPASVVEQPPVAVSESEPVAHVPPTPATEPKPVVEASVAPETPEKSATNLEVGSDSPPLVHTPSKDDVPVAPAAKSEERRKPVGKLQLRPPALADPLPTPDSELEDAAALAHAIITSELHTPTVTASTPPISTPAPAPATDPVPAQLSRLSVQEPEVPSPPVGSVSLTQIGVKPKPSTAALIESSVTTKTEPSSKTPEATEAPKKKVVKKVIKKEGASSTEAPVPPPRKKEKKPKDK